MGILKLIASSIKAVPVLGRFFSKIGDIRKEREAQSRYEEKLNFIDAAVDQHSKSRVRVNKTKQRKGANRTSSVSRRRKSSSSVDKGSTKNSSGTGVSTGKKVKSSKKKKLTVKKGDTQPIKRPRKNRSKK